MDENTENLPGTPPEVAEAAGAVNLLPEKSQKLYKIAYNQFMKWKQEKKITSFSERVILAYFADLSSKYKISTLWTYYSMLRSTLNINHNINIEQYHKLRAFLKRQGENYQPKKAKTLSPQQITKFITEAPDVKYLATKVALIMGIMGACRTQELHSMRIQDIKDLNSAFLVTLPNTKTKIRRSFTLDVYTKKHFPNEDCQIIKHLLTLFSVYEKMGNFNLVLVIVVVKGQNGHLMPKKKF
ncbi:hypothetical protein Zmor_021324 [Zophobas morio]|uniref:Uncharacterized protein n=1 Tax=Zophobas morio TaxID=2755281 RepID=A0AA38I5A3_9CUCU|nr:hypothetical protein Zmor_021324 [Zophobas morio]